MRLPFGLHLPSIIVGVLVAYFVVPMVMGLLNRPAVSRNAA